MKIFFYPIFFLISFLLFLSLGSIGQSYDLSISNRHLVAANILEFDVYIHNNENTSPWALRIFQSAYQFSAGFVNGGYLSGAYVSGTSELESSFGKTWAFSYNANQHVLNQSSNTGSVCPGALIGNIPRKIGRFRVINTVSFGCVEDSLSFKLSGSGTLWLSVGKYNSLDCSDPGGSLVTNSAHAFTDSSSDIPLQAVLVPKYTSSCDSITVLDVQAEGGAAPYFGNGPYACGSGWFSFDVRDARGCVGKTDTLLSLPAIMETFVEDSSCQLYVFPWGDTSFFSGLFHHHYLSLQGCDSLVHYDIKILPSVHIYVEKRICTSELPFFWKDQLLSLPGHYSSRISQPGGCDSIFHLQLVVDSLPAITSDIYGLSAGVCAAEQVSYSVDSNSLISGFLWTVSPSVTLVSGQGTSRVTIDFRSSISSENICVQAFNHCGSSLLKCKTVIPLPSDSARIFGPLTVTKGQKVHFSSYAFGATKYTWTVPRGWSLVSGQGSSHVMVRAGPASGYLKCTPSNACGLGNVCSTWVSINSAREAYLSPEPVFGPNPVCDLLYVQSPMEVYDHCTLIDPAGRPWGVFPIPCTIDLKDSPHGVYRLIFTGKSGKSCKNILHVCK